MQNRTKITLKGTSRGPGLEWIENKTQLKSESARQKKDTHPKIYKQKQLTYMY